MRKGDTVELRESVMSRKRGTRGTLVEENYNIVRYKPLGNYVKIKFGDGFSIIRRDLVQKVSELQLKMESVLR